MKNISIEKNNWMDFNDSDEESRIKDSNIVIMYFWDNCIELIAYPELTNENITETSMEALYCDDKVEVIYVFMKYSEAIDVLKFWEYELYDEDFRVIKTYVTESYVLETSWSHREIWTKKEDVKAFKFNDEEDNEND